MELQFEVKQIPCMQQAQHREQIQEQSQEVRLGEMMPDIGRVLCSWGQVLLRGKEWHGTMAGVSGGVMTWTMYEPEDGGEPYTVESWIPMNLKWETENPENGGVIQCLPILKSVDARSTGARKLSVRATVSVSADIMVYGSVNMYAPKELPQDVQMLQHTYPVKMSKEAGEKAFDLDEILELPASCPELQKIVYYCLQPQVEDQKVMADKIVFRGTARLHLLYCSEQGMLTCWDTEIPFSQYAELDREYNPEADASVCACVTSLELEINENGELHLKAGIVGQYLIYECENIESVEDIYSYKCEITPAVENIRIPAILDSRTEIKSAEMHPHLEAAEILDYTFWPEPAEVQREETQVSLHTSGRFQVLYRDLEGKLQNSGEYWNESWNLPADEDCDIAVEAYPAGRVWANFNGGQGDLKMDLQVKTVAKKAQGFPVICGIATGEPVSRDGVSLIISKRGDQSLWQLAKNCGSTVEAIRKLNRLEGEPESSQFLLVPVL